MESLTSEITRKENLLDERRRDIKIKEKEIVDLKELLEDRQKYFDN
jgi:hypothetical protein